MSLSACDDYRKRHSEIEDEVYAGGLGVVAIAGVFLANVLLLFVSQKVPPWNRFYLVPNKSRNYALATYMIFDLVSYCRSSIQRPDYIYANSC